MVGARVLDERRKKIQYLIDTDMKIATCNRCRGYVFACMVSGIKIAVDPAPLDVDHYRQALIAGKSTFDVIFQGEKPWRLRARRPSSRLDGATILGEHGCGAAGQDATKVQEVPEVPPSAPVSALGFTGTPDVLPAAHRGSQGLPAGSVIRSRSDLRCEECRGPVDPEEPHWAIECGRYRWARHETCPSAPAVRASAA